MFVGKENFKTSYVSTCWNLTGKSLDQCSDLEKYEVLVAIVKGQASKIRTETINQVRKKQEKEVFYFSMEFLIGCLLKNYMINLGILDIVQEGLEELGIHLDDLLAKETDPGLGNGGLGRLAACFMDSMAFLGVPGGGIGIRYRYGLFQQKIEKGFQTEYPDCWLDEGYPWETQKKEQSIIVKFAGSVERQYEKGKEKYLYRDYQEVLAVPYDIPIIGYGGKTVNHLRLWDAQPVTDNFDLQVFNRGDYVGAVRDSTEIHAITSVLYPDDSIRAGKVLRLKQEYFLVAAGLGDLIRRYKQQYGPNQWNQLPERLSVHINDTHPALCIPEMMRILMDEEGLEWDDAWEITQRTISYTNHTILPEALEKWPIDILQSILPRIYMIIDEINRRLQEEVYSIPNGNEMFHNVAILWDNEARMASLSVVGSYSVNGVANLHTEILKNDVMKDFYRLYPEKFNNKTNGVSHRRFLIESNPGLTELITSAIGEDWVTKPSQLEQLLPYREDTAFLERMSAVKRENKARLASYIKNTSGLVVNPDSVFDIQVKRIHAYKRQVLFAFKIMDAYNELKENPNLEIQPHTFIFAGKAASSYAYAKEVIKLVNSIADVINNDPAMKDKLRVVFMENYSVSSGQIIVPAAEISEQISAAGKEASGTGNMKFMFNGAITLGTMDGANVEMYELLGDENIRIFGLRAEEALELGQSGMYRPNDIIQGDPRLKLITDQLVNGFFHKSNYNFWGVWDSLIKHGDEYFVIKDFDDYVSTWMEMNDLYQDRNAWNRISLSNIAKAGFFSSDRAITEYAKDIWQVKYRKI